MHLVQGPKAVAGITWAQSSSELRKSNPRIYLTWGLGMCANFTTETLPWRCGLGQVRSRFHQVSGVSLK